MGKRLVGEVSRIQDHLWFLFMQTSPLMYVYIRADLDYCCVYRY